MMGFLDRIARKFKILLSDLNLIDRNAIIGRNCTIIGVRIGKDVVVGDYCKIKYANIEGRVKIGQNTSIWGPNVLIKSEINEIIIGNYCSIARNVSIQESN